MAKLPTPTEALTVYGLVLMICGALAFQAAGMATNARSALIVGNGGAALAFILAGGCGSEVPEKGTRRYKIWMASVHLAIVYPALLGCVLAWRLSKAAAVASKAYLVPYLGVMCAASVLTTIVVVANKPKPKAKTEAEAESKDGKKGKDPGAKSKKEKKDE